MQANVPVEVILESIVGFLSERFISFLSILAIEINMFLLK